VDYLIIEKERINTTLLEELLRTRIGWVDEVVSPFAIASRNLRHSRRNFSWQPESARLRKATRTASCIQGCGDLLKNAG
jgi:hypothetical protein